MKLSEGVYARYYRSGKRAIRVHFTYRGVRCQETLRGLDPDKKQHVRYAANVLGSVHSSMASGTFRYPDHFPESKRARLFGHAVSTRTVKQIATAWLADIKRSLPHSTYRSYAGPCKRFIFPAIGELRVRDVTVEHIRRMFREADISLKTARNYSIPLRAIFGRAIDDDDIDRNPMDRIKVRSLIPMDRHRSEYVVDPFDQGEIERALAACKKHRPGWLNYMQFAFYTGLRTSELYGLRWSDVDLEARTVRVQRAVVERKVKEPKTASSIRDVELTDAAYEALRRQRAVTELAGAEVFINPRNGEPLFDYQVSAAAFDVCQKHAKVRRRNQYQTRHTFASNMLSGGAHPLYVAQQLGHSDLQMLFRVYAKWIASDGPQGQRAGFGKVEGLK